MRKEAKNGKGSFFHGLSIFLFAGRKFGRIKDEMIKEEMKKRSR
jgi:hypothetical protein